MRLAPTYHSGMMRFESTAAMACLAVFAGVASSQTPASAPSSRPAAESRPEPGEELLRAVDARLYFAGREGLSSLRFSYAPEGTGALTPDFRVQVTWKKGTEAIVAFLDLEKKPLDRSKTHPFLDRDDPERPGKKMADRYVDGARVLLKAFLGTPYETVYASYRKRVEKRTVNGREETTLVMEPTKAGRMRRIEMSFGPDGMPWRIRQSLSRAEDENDAITLYPAFTAVAERLLLTSYKEDLGSRTDQVVIEYQKSGGFLIPAKIERIVKGDSVGGSKTVFDDVDAGG
jgi:hypothetical protein